MSKLTILTFAAVLFCQNVLGANVPENSRINENTITTAVKNCCKSVNDLVIELDEHCKKYIEDYGETHLATYRKNYITNHDLAEKAINDKLKQCEKAGKDCSVCLTPPAGEPLPDKEADIAEIEKTMRDRYADAKAIYDKAKADCQAKIDWVNALCEKLVGCGSFDVCSLGCYMTCSLQAEICTDTFLPEIRRIFTKAKSDALKIQSQMNTETLKKQQELNKKVTDARNRIIACMNKVISSKPSFFSSIGNFFKSLVM